MALWWHVVSSFTSTSNVHVLNYHTEKSKRYGLSYVLIYLCSKPGRNLAGVTNMAKHTHRATHSANTALVGDFWLAS